VVAAVAPLRPHFGYLFRRDTQMAAAVSGTIKRIVSDKGFGFVAADDGTEYFFHNSAVQGTRFDELREGQKVTFEKGQGPKGPRAENVRPS
jgi:cold shock protein